MPKVIGHTPPWLSRPSPGAKIFSDPAPESPASPSKHSSYIGSPPSADYQGPRRLVASRGTELFTVVGNKIRWADLAAVRDEWEENSHSGSSRFGLSRSGGDAPEQQAYRVLDVSIYYQIRQIVLSPSGMFLAIATEHTVHIAVLPPSSRLRDHERSLLKLKTFQLGPTIHVIPESPLASVLWHPLAASTATTDCIVTVTAEAAVRVWELDRSNKWSFERPALAIDLRKLADGVSCDQDFEPSGFGKTRGFSVDDFDMEASAACFGGRGKDDEDAWASMTIWTAMRNGDIYALCPLIPARWKPTSTTIPSLSTNAVSRMASIAGEDADMDERRAADQQYEWVQEIDNEEPFLLESTDSLGEFEVRLRPQNPSAIPRLQGPFAIQPEDDAADMEISDIYVHAASIDERDLLAGEDDDDFDQFTSHGVPFTTICVATTDNEVWFAMDLDGVSGQWLPKKGKSAFGVPSSDAKELTLIDTFALDDAGANAQDNWPMFTCDVAHNYSVFLTTSKQIYSFSLNDWITRLAAEMTGTEAVDPGMRTRLETACDSQICITNRLLGVEDPTEMLSAPTVVDDVSLGYLLLSATPSSAYSVVFDQAHLQASTNGPSSPELMATPASRQIVAVPEQPENNDVETLPTRSPYVPAKIFYANHLYPIEHLKQRLPPNLKRAMTENPMRLSPAMLEIMTVTHRTISGQSAELEKAAAELFRRCERLREELGGQVQQMAELAQRLQHLKSGEEVDEDGNVTAKKSVDARIRDAQERQAKLSARYETLRRKVGRVGSAKRELSSKEKTWIDEIDALGHDVGIGGEGEDDRNANARLDKRFGRVKQFAHELLEASKSVEQQQASAPESAPSPMSASMSASMSTTKSGGSGTSSASFGVSSRLQKERIADVMTMVEREGAVIDAVMKRLERLKVEY
ncbi:hypothetical protein LTR06_005351 [Exophiala xenobiotica]|nr:hypothetical protein LTR06_005351 [Exophiala xenobiotica]